MSVVYAGCYQYTADLLALDNARRAEAGSTSPQLQGISSPLKDRLSLWQRALAEHPDRLFRGYVLEGIASGFRIGFDHASRLNSATRNMPSAASNPQVIDAYISAEAQAGRMLGPFSRADVSTLHVNRMGLVPKGRTPGKWRLITDLSFPEGASVNDGVPADLCSLRYTTVSQVATAAMQLGKGALLAKMDIQSAYRLIPVHPDDRHLLGVVWRQECYVDGMLPFGLRSAPKIFTAVADALEWILRRRGVSFVEHYLDDFVTIGPPSSGVCGDNLGIIQRTCAELGVPLAAGKLEGPSSCLTFLGIEMDTVCGVLRLPPEKLARLKEEARSWASKRPCRRRQLESLIGLLHHACQVVRPGRTFLRRMIDLLKTPSATKGHHHIRLNAGFRADLGWWNAFVERWNGVSILPDRERLGAVVVTSDASGGWGCGAWSESEWFQWQWTEEAREFHISFKELFAENLACATWAESWRGRKVRWQCDNQAAVQAVRNRSCRDPAMMHLLRCLFFIEAWFSFELMATYLPGRENTLADDLSRNRLSSFLSKAQHADRTTAQINKTIPGLLLQREGWTSHRWMLRFVGTVTAE